jgi:hypothetical protein
MIRNPENKKYCRFWDTLYYRNTSGVYDISNFFSFAPYYRTGTCRRIDKADPDRAEEGASPVGHLRRSVSAGNTEGS